MTRNSADRTKALIMQVLWALMFFLRMKTKPVSRKHAAPALRTAFTVANAWGVPGADRSGRAYSTMSTAANTATERTAITQRAAGDSAANVLTTGEGDKIGYRSSAPELDAVLDLCLVPHRDTVLGKPSLSNLQRVHRRRCTRFGVGY